MLCCCWLSYLRLADLLLKLQRYEDAEKDAWELLERNPDCIQYYDLLYRTKEVLTLEAKHDLLEKCTKKFPIARLPKLLLLETMTGKAMRLLFLRFKVMNLSYTLIISCARTSERVCPLSSFKLNVFMIARKNGKP